MTLPDGEVLTHGYAGNGLLSQVSSSLGPTYLSGVQYNALNLPRQYTLGSGTTALMSQTYYGVDAAGSPYGALKTIQLQQGTNPLLVNRDIGYDYAGNVTSVNDLVNGENISYGYDDLDRLTSVGSPVSESYQYNQIGNMTSKGGQTLSYGDANHKHAVTAYAGSSYAYDANGCMTTRGSQSIKYNPENVPVRVNSGGSRICRFAYDGDNVRRKRLEASGTIHYLGAFERNLGNGLDTTQVDTKYYTVALGKLSRLIAFRKAGTLYYAGTDHLGSTIRVTDAGFNAVDQMRYKPYGESRDSGTNLKTDHKFTSQIEDAIIGLFWYNSRAYDPVIGRFVVADTIVPEASNPQALSRYSYCFNNPLKYVDPSGRDPGDDDPQWKAEFERLHGHYPEPQDEADRKLSLAYAGTGPNGSWTADDWEAYRKVQRILGADLLRQIGKEGLTGADAYTVGVSVLQLLGGRGVDYFNGPDNTTIAVTNLIWPDANAMTFGNMLIMKPEFFGDSLTLIHEYVHVLQYRSVGAGYIPRYVVDNGLGNRNGPYEAPAYQVEEVYRTNPWLPKPWELRWAGGHRYWTTP